MKNKKNLLRKLGEIVVGATALITANCASFNQNTREFEEQYRYMEKVKKELNIKDDAFLDRNLRNGYFATFSGGMDLRTTAGIMAGTIKIKKTENGYKGDGMFSQYLQQDTLDKVCEIADKDRNKAITNEEARNVLLDAYRTSTRQP